MKPDPIPLTHEATEARITALLLGELTSAEEAEVHRSIEADTEMGRLHDRLKLTIGLLREAIAQPVAATAETAGTPTTKLSDERRQQLLQRFKTVKPSELAAPRRRGVPWFVPMSIAALLMAFLGLAGLMSGGALGTSKTRLNRVLLSSLEQKVTQDLPGELQLGRGGREGAKDNPANTPLAIQEAARQDESEGTRTVTATSTPPSPPTDDLAAFNRAATAPTSLSSSLAGTESQTLVTTAPTLARRYGLIPNQALKSDKKTTVSDRIQAQGGSRSIAAVNGSSSRSTQLDALPTLTYLPSAIEQLQPTGPTPTSPPLSSSVDPTWRFDAGSTPSRTGSALDGEVGAVHGVGGGDRFGRGMAGSGGAVARGVSAAAPPPDFSFESKGFADRESRPVFFTVADEAAPAQALGLVTKTPELAAGVQVTASSPAARPALEERSLIERSPMPLAPLGEKNFGNDSFAKSSRGLDRATRGEAEVALKQVEGVNGREELRRLSRDRDKNSQLTVIGESIAESKQLASNFDINGVSPSLGYTKDEGRKEEDSTKSKRERLNELESVDGRLANEQRKAVANVEAFALIEKKTESAAAVRVAGKPASKAALTDESQVQGLNRMPTPTPQPEISALENAFSTFSLNVTDVSFKLAAASLEKGTMPEPATVRGEEFLNAFNYRDADPSPGMPVAFASERAQYPFAHNREIIRFAVRTAARGRESGRPLNVVLLLDNSGSMERADRVRITREALLVLGRQLQPQDRISVVAFARTARLWVDALPGNQAGELAERVGNLTPEGGTNLEEALNLAYATAARHFLSSGVNRVVLLTDGAANLGDVAPESLKRKVESWRHRGVALDCFGIGWEGLNDDLLEMLSRNGDGRYGFINTPEEATTEFAAQLAGALHVAASDVKVQIEFNPQRVVAWRQIGYAKHQLTKEQFRDNTVDAAELAAAESGNALYVIQPDPNGAGLIGTARVRFREPESGIYRELEWPVPYTGAAAPLDRSPATLRLATTASAFSEWLTASPFAGEVTPDRLLGYLQAVPAAFEPDTRPQKLEWMIRQAKSISGR